MAQRKMLRLVRPRRKVAWLGFRLGNFRKWFGLRLYRRAFHYERWDLSPWDRERCDLFECWDLRELGRQGFMVWGSEGKLKKMDPIEEKNERRRS